MNKTESQNPAPEQFPVSEALRQLQYAGDILREMGLRVIERNLVDREDDFARGAPFPIVRDGLDGIRASYSKSRGLKIWFTNGFEDPKNPKRQEIAQRLREAGLPVVV
jgi:hypothetical protein